MTLQISDAEPLAPGGFEIDAQTDAYMKALGTFTLSHPKWRKAFVDCSRQDVLYTLLHHIRANHITVILRADRSIGGYVLYTPDETSKTLHIAHLLADAPNAMEGFLIAWLRKYPGWDITAIRRGVQRHYCFNELANHYFVEE